MHATTLILKSFLYLSVQIIAVSCAKSVPQNRDRGEGDCKHDRNKLHSNCTVSFHGYEVNLYTQLFRCSQPTEMMVVTQVDGLNVDHARVFVNDDERVQLTGYTGAYVHVQMHAMTMLDSIQVKVSYYSFDRLETVAYDHNFTLHTELCPPKNDESEILTPFAITIIAALTFVILSGMISFIVLYKLHQRRAGHQTKLVSQMESTAMTKPYQVGPSDNSLRIEYKITKESQKTSDKDEVFMNPAVVQMTNQKQLVDLDVSRSRPNTSKINKTSSTEPVSRPRPKPSKSNEDSIYPTSTDATRPRPDSSKFHNDRVHPTGVDVIRSRPDSSKTRFDSTVTMLPADQRASKHSLTQV